MTYTDLVRGSGWSLSVDGGVPRGDVSGLKDLFSNDPTAVFTKFSRRPAELVVVIVEVTFVLDADDDGDWKTLSLDTAAWG